MLFPLRTAALLVAPVPLWHVGPTPSEGAPPQTPAAVVATSSCPSPSAEELDVATSRVRFLLEQDGEAPWRAELGLTGVTRGEAVALVGPEHESTCVAINAINPFLRDGRLRRVYFRVRDVYLSVPAYRYLGEELIIAFKGNVSYDTMHLSSF